MSRENSIRLTKQTLPQLQELLDRQKALLKNKKLLGHLKDKGASVQQLHDKVEKELEYRKSLSSLEESLSALNINDRNNKVLKNKHIQYICSKEKLTEDPRYRPHRTLVHKPANSAEKSPKKFVEVTSACEPKLLHEPTKLIPLAESLMIENDQALRIMEEKARKALSSLQFEVEKSDSSSSDEEEIIENEALIEETEDKYAT